MNNAFRVLPEDEHNRILLENVHPSNWQNPEPQGRYNLVVIGAGTAGLVTAAGAAGLGAKVALIEKNLMGGDCLNVGCVPSKALISAARSFAKVRDASQKGIRVPDGTSVDFPAVMERMRKLRSEISRLDSASRFRDLGVDVFIGEGRFQGDNIVQVGDTKTAIQTRRDRHRCPRLDSSHTWFERCGSSHQRNPLFAHRITEETGDHRSRTNWL